MAFAPVAKRTMLFVVRSATYKKDAAGSWISTWNCVAVFPRGKVFDRVNHDVLMGRLAKRIEDRRVLRLIRGYLNAAFAEGEPVMEPRGWGCLGATRRDAAGWSSVTNAGECALG
jgi:hypothetical protein